MKRSVLCLFLSVLLVGIVHPQAQKDSPPKPTAKPQKSTSFIDRVLEFLSISYTPGAQKSPDAVTNGQVWIADLRTSAARALTSGGNYRSPIFREGSTDILALRGSDLVRIPLTGGEATKLHSIEGILKLVGAGTQDPGKVLILLHGETGGHPRVGLLAIDSGTVTNLPYDPGSTQDLQMVEDLEGWSRVNGDKRVYSKRQTKEDMSGTIQWSDVFLVAHGQQPVDVSRCDGINCGQPSLSHDGNLLVYIKERAEH